MVWHWSCASALCENNWRTKGVTYYSLPGDPNLRRKYSAILKNDNINWSKQVICSAHWRGGKRRSVDHIPELICSTEQLKKFEKELSKKKAKKRTNKKKLPSKSHSSKETKKKISCIKTAQSVIDSNICKNKRKPPKERSAFVPRKKKKTIKGYEKENRLLEKELEKMKSENDVLSQRLADVERLHNEIKVLQERCVLYEKRINVLEFEEQKRKFDYINLKRNEREFFYMCGLTVKEFDCLFDCLAPFVHLLIYPDCVDKQDKIDSNNRLLDKQSELLVALTIARHATDLGVMAKLVGGGSSTMSRIFVAWLVLIRTVFESIDLKPLPGFLEKQMPQKFLDGGFGDCGILGDNTETWIAQSENFDLNNVTFSHYKNHTTGKVSVWIFPHGELCKCSDAYPGTISDEKLTDEIGVLDYCPPGKTVMTDKGFAITDLCHERGLHHNRPPIKYNCQYDDNDICLNFDIATLRIHNENAIGRIRDWVILNQCWPSGRVDLLGTCWIALAHIVNLTKKPVGPKDAELQQLSV